MKRRRRVVGTVEARRYRSMAHNRTEQRPPSPPSCQLFSSRRKPHCRAGERSGGPGSVRLSREEWKEGGVRHNNAKEALSLPLLPISPFPALSSPPPSKKALRRRPKVESAYLPTCAPVRPLACARKACSSAREEMGGREGGRKMPFMGLEVLFHYRFPSKSVSQNCDTFLRKRNKCRYGQVE